MTNDAKRREKEVAIYQAVLRLIENGSEISDIKVQQIAGEAGIGKGTIYEYFASKDEIMQGMVNYCLRTELLGFRAAVENCTTVTETVDAFLAYLEQGIQQRLGTYQLVGNALKKYRLPENPKEKKELAKELLTPLEALYQRLTKTGELEEEATAPYCAYVAGSALLSMVAAQSLSGPFNDPKSVRRMARSMILKAITKEK